MRNGRSHRRSTGRFRAQLAEVDAKAPAVMFGSGRGNGSELLPISFGRALFLVPVPPAGASNEVLFAYSIRATATVTGRSTCA